MHKFEAALKMAVAECERTVCINLLRASPELTIGDLARATRPVADLLARITIGDLTGDEVPQVNVRVGRSARTTAKATSRASPLLQVDQQFARVRAAMGRVSRSPKFTATAVAEIPQVIDALEQWAREGRGSLQGPKSRIHAQLAGALSDFRVSVDGVVAALDTLKRACGDFVTLTDRTWHINMDPNPAHPGVRPSDTRRWFGELESWMRRAGMSKETVAKRSQHTAARILALFDQPQPNPPLQLFLDLLAAAGASFNGVSDNTSAAVVARVKEITVRDNVSISALARSTGIRRPHLSTLFNAPDPNPMLATFDQLVVALGVEKEMCLVQATARQLWAPREERPHPSPAQTSGWSIVPPPDPRPYR